MIQSITYRDHQISCSVRGRGEAVIFLHGWPTNSRLWQSQVDALEGHYKTITLDWLGFGASDKPVQHHYTFSHKKEVLNAVIAALLPADEKITLVAHDLGGPPAIMWASENQSRVRQLVLLNTITYTLKTPTDAFSEILLHTPGLKNLFVSPFGLKMVLQTNIKSRGKAVNQKIREVLEDYRKVPPRLKQKTIMEPMAEGRKNEIPALSAQFKQLNTKKHLIIAKNDPLCFAHVDKLRAENPEVPVHFLNRCGHYIPLDRPDELTEILLRILPSNN